MRTTTFSIIAAAVLAAATFSATAYAETATTGATAAAPMKAVPRGMARHHGRHFRHNAYQAGWGMPGMGYGMGQGMGYGMGQGMGCGMGMMGGGMGYGMGMMGGGGGMMGGMGHSFGMSGMGALKLSSEQRGKVNALNDELRKKHWAGMGVIMDESTKLRDLYAADKRDPAAIGQVYQRIFDQKRQMIEASIDTQNRIDDILTPEQRQQLKDMKPFGARCHCPQ